VPRRISREGLLSYFFCDYALPPWSMVEGVSKLEPARFLTWKDGSLSASAPFWRLAPPPLSDLGSEDELSAELWARLERAVKRQMVADVPVGVFLSGGLDSSSVAEVARRCTPERLRTFSIGFEMKSFDESGYARLVARHIGSDHIEEIAGEGTLLDSLDPVVESLDEPLADHSYLPTYLLSRLAARHVKVVLGGDGGDELWGGYPTYKAHEIARLYAVLPRAARDELVPRLAARLPVTTGYQALDWKVRRFVGRWDDDWLRRHFRWLSSVDLPDLPRALPWSAGEIPPPLRVAYPALSDPMNALLAVDFSSYMHASVLTKVDRASMAHSLEVRPPLLDNECIDWAFSLPGHLKVRRGRTKHLLKRAARPHVPRAIVDRPKRGFGIPLIAWLRGPLAPSLDAALDDSILWEGDLLDRRYFRALRDSHLAGAADASKPLWALIVLSRWVRREGIQG
jgi:asparagine synthase (glutamine-hydrolysing)